MKPMTIWLILIAVSVLPFASRKATAQQISKSDSISFCDLLRNPEKYDGKEVTVSASYRYGFEWQEIFCLDCRDKGKTWLEMDDDIITAESERILKRLPKNDGTVNALFTGIFVSSRSSFGDGGYRFGFLLKKISQAKVVTKSGWAPEQLPDKIRKKVCGN
jgi:hypothetical protein